MAIYSDRWSYIFFANPQTASKSIARTLRDSVEGQPLPEREVRLGDDLLVPKHHGTWRQLIENGLMSREKLDSLFKFTSVRNPYDLLVSRYLKRKGRFAENPEKYRWAQTNSRIQASMAAAQGQTFPEWCAIELKRHRERGSTVKGPLEYLDHADFVIRFEALQAGFDEVLARLGIEEPIPIARENVTVERKDGERRRHFTEYYDEPTRELVARAWAPVIERFGYAFG